LLRWIKVGALAGLIACYLEPAVAQQTRGEFRVEEIRVEGAQRIEAETVRSHMSIRRGDTANAESLDRSLKDLFRTGLFRDVTLHREGSTVIVRVVENPVINRLAFEGNGRISDDVLRDEVRLRPRVVYTPTQVQNDVQRIIDLYRRSGRFAARVEPKVIQLDQNRVDLVFEIEEGKATQIRKISFIGNKRFDDSSLRGVIQTKESTWWRFFGGDSYDPDRLTFDRELLRKHYLKNGYADFRVISAVAELAPDQEGFFITFTIEEGERYKFGKIDVTTALRDLDPEKLKERVVAVEGEWYDANAMEESVGNLSDAAGELGYAFVDVRRRVRRDREQRRMHITFNVREGPRVFVERINIVGNVRTRDEVIRREFQLVEGDAFNTAKLRKSRSRIRNLGFFEKVEIDNVPGSAPDKTVINIEVQEKSTGEISFGAGFSSSVGVLGDISIRERNLVGSGQDLSLSLRLAARQQRLDLKFTEPYFLDRELSAGFDLFSNTRDLQEESSFDRKELGTALRIGYRISEHWSQRWRYNLREDKVTDVDNDASLAIKEQEGEFVTSSIGQTLSYDTRDNRFASTEGIVFSYSNEFAGLGGDNKFIMNQVRGTLFFPVWEDVVGSVTAGTGYIFGIGDDVRIINRFFMGGSDLRGFDNAGVGPRDLQTDDAVGGKWFYNGSFQLTFPLGLPNEFGIKGRVFSDFGSLGGVDGSAGAVTDTGSLRAAIGAGLAWNSPFGPLSFDFSQAILKEEFDKTEVFRFSFGTRF
jgi:outer membrane protein insertion porin family